jgi:hypothetical protein
MAEARGGVYYSEPTDTTRGTRSYREGPPPRARAQERRLDVAVPSWPDIDARISAFLEVEWQRFDQLLEAKLEEHDDIWREAIAQVIVKLIDEKPGVQGPPGPAASCRASACGRPDRLPMKIRSSLSRAHLFRHSEIPDRGPVAPIGCRSRAPVAMASSRSYVGPTIRRRATSALTSLH